MGKKIVLIGAGSTQFAKRVIGDILWFPDMQIDEIALVDINAYKLGVMKPASPLPEVIPYLQ